MILFWKLLHTERVVNKANDMTNLTIILESDGIMTNSEQEYQLERSITDTVYLGCQLIVTESTTEIEEEYLVGDVRRFWYDEQANQYLESNGMDVFRYVFHLEAMSRMDDNF